MQGTLKAQRKPEFILTHAVGLSSALQGLNVHLYLGAAEKERYLLIL